MGDIDVMYFIVIRDINVIFFLFVVFFLMIRIRVDNEIIESERKYFDYNKCKGIVYLNGYGMGSFFFCFCFLCWCMMIGSGFVGGRSVL